MNKQELKKRIEELPFEYGLVLDRIKVNRNGLLELIEQLDEPQKVTVPQFVADWYEEHKDNLEYNIWDWMKYNLEPKKRENVIFSRWLGKTANNPVETLIKMKLYGYEVEKEKRYLVKMKGVTDQTRTLKRNIDIETWYFGNPTNYEDINAHHTRKELEQAGFDWVFDCPGIEIEEVQDDSKV